MATTSETVANAKCFVCLTHRQHLAIQTYLLAILAGTSTSPATLSRLAGCVSCIPKSRLLALQAYLLAVAQGQSTDPGTLMLAANCNCVPPGIEDAFRTYGLSALAGVSQDPETLAPLASCFMCLNPDQIDYIQTYLIGVWAGINVSTIAGIESALESSSAFTGLTDAALGNIKSYLEGTVFTISTVIIDDGTGTFWKVIVATDGLVGMESTSGPATPDVILNDGSGGLWKLIVDTSGLIGTESSAGPETTAPEIDDGTGQLWRLIVDVTGLLGAMSVP
jgi:hypothetical protein